MNDGLQIGVDILKGCCLGDELSSDGGFWLCHCDWNTKNLEQAQKAEASAMWKEASVRYCVICGSGTWTQGAEKWKKMG